MWGVVGRVRGPNTVASDTDEDHLLDSGSTDAVAYDASLHPHPHVLEDSLDLRDVLPQIHDLLDHYTLQCTEAKAAVLN